MVEEFNPENAKSYSQAQCAVVIERVFSGLYRYLQFKSTAGEEFQRHINIDNGYKYLTTESIMESDNADSHVYYSEDDEIPYLRYLTKIHSYLDGGNYLLTSSEKEVLGQFIEILSEKEADWL